MREELGRISDDELLRIRADRDTAIELLVERGRLPQAVGDRARRAELGTVHRVDTELQGRR